MTKNQILNTKCQPNFLISIPKDKWTVVSFILELVVSQSNEKNKCNKIILIQLNRNILSIFLKKKNA